MANQEHLDILKRGVVEWNNWRAENPAIVPDLRGANLRLAHLRGAHRNKVDLKQANLREALREAFLSGTDLPWVHHVGADLHEANLGGADLRGANLRGANLRGAQLGGADLQRVNLREADLREAVLMEAFLSRADLRGTSFHEAVLAGTTFADTDLSEVKGLDAVEHLGPSTIGIDTLYKSGGKIPEVFLRGCGVPDTFIEYLPSLIGAQELIQYYSCFISYSTKDEDFARRLHERMRREHLRVWFAPEDMKGGDKLYDQIERAIQLHDRLLLVLSDHSMHSEWVFTEILRAREVERKEQRRKLFPIRLVDMEQIRDWSRFDADSGKDLAVEVREYFIPDFTHWKDHDAFEAAFARLLRDLRTAERPATGTG